MVLDKPFKKYFRLHADIRFRQHCIIVIQSAGWSAGYAVPVQHVVYNQQYPPTQGTADPKNDIPPSAAAQ